MLLAAPAVVTAVTAVMLSQQLLALLAVSVATAVPRAQLDPPRAALAWSWGPLAWVALAVTAVTVATPWALPLAAMAVPAVPAVPVVLSRQSWPPPLPLAMPVKVVLAA